MNTFSRGDIFYIKDSDSQQPVGAEIWPNRAGLIISNDALNKSSGVVEIVYLSTSPRKRPSPTHVPVNSGTKKAIAMCEQIHTVDKSRLTDKIDHITDEEMVDIEEALLFSLQINTGRNPQGIFKKFERQLALYPDIIAQ